ncbi:MAG: error-prone DNA polymerase [Planctomycetaceae bacterium]
MPDPPPEKRRPQISAPVPVSTDSALRAAGYAELHCFTNYSFLEGASHPDELVVRAAELGYRALAITDRNSLAGVVRAHVAAREVGLKLLIGAEITPDDAAAAVLLATDRAAYGRLCRLITRGRLNAPKGTCALSFDDIAEFSEGVIACVLPDPGNASDRDGFPTTLLRYRELFGDRCHLTAELHRGTNDRAQLEQLMQTARQARVPLIAANGVRYHDPARQKLQDVVTATRHGCTVSELGMRMHGNAERHLKSPMEMQALFSACPGAVERTLEVAARCTFSLDELRYEYPEELCPPGTTPLEHLTCLTWEGVRKRYPDQVPEKVRGLIEHELALIAELHYEAYFLTVWDLVRFARSRGILCQGRGSAANSAVCYCLGVTEVNPDKIDVLFERFVSKERDEAPDIDIDFEHERREEVIQYVYEKYGRERAGMTAEVITYRERSAVRDVGKALGYSLAEVDALAKTLERVHEEERFASRFREAGLDPMRASALQLRELVREILGFPRHLSQHVGGLVLTRGPLCEIVPIENASMPGRTVIEWDKDDLDALGILKVDCLALGMLTAIRKGLDLLKQHQGKRFTLASIPAEDPVVYEMIQRADTVGVFQIESRAQMSMLPRLKPACFYDLVIEVAIVRPGPIQGDMVHPYLRRRAGDEPVEFPDERIKQVLEKTKGVPLFQEQAMRLAVVAAGFTPDEADQLRRAMAAWRRSGVLEKFRQKLIDGMTANGYEAEFAERVYKQIRGFGEYGFPESHAASFALLVYASAWLKCHYPAAFAAAILNSQPMGFYAPAQLVADAKKHGVEIRPVDVNYSLWDCTLEPCDHLHALRLGFRMVSGLSQTFVDRLIKTRSSGLFDSFEDFASRTGLSSAVLSKLSKADAFGSISMRRRQAHWQSLPSRQPLPLFDDDNVTKDSEEPPAQLPQPTPLSEVVADYRAVGLSLKDHPMKFLRPMLRRLRVLKAADLATHPPDRRVKVAGLVLLRQRPGTAKGITFVTIEDETGQANLIIHQQTWERHHQTARTASAMIAHGILQRQDSVIHIVVSRLQDLSRLLTDLQTPSRDFH